jgi:hypothetical protein
MIYRCENKSVYLTNPLERKSIDLIMSELTSESVLLVRAIDVLKRFSANKYNLSDLEDLKKSNLDLHEQSRWKDFNVIGQVLAILIQNELIDSALFEENPHLKPFLSEERAEIKHLRIPASYKSGITLFARRGSSLFTEITNAPDLPLA